MDKKDSNVNIIQPEEKTSIFDKDTSGLEKFEKKNLKQKNLKKKQINLKSKLPNKKTQIHGINQRKNLEQ